MAGVFRTVGYTLLLVLCGSSMFLGQGGSAHPFQWLRLLLARLLLRVLCLCCLGVRVVGAQGEAPVMGDGHEEEAEVEVEDEVRGGLVEWGVRCLP